MAAGINYYLEIIPGIMEVRERQPSQVFKPSGPVDNKEIVLKICINHNDCNV